MISKPISKYAIKSVNNSFILFCVYLAVIAIFLITYIVFGLIFIKPFTLFHIHAYSWFYNMMLMLVLSAGILGTDLKRDYMPLILARPIKRVTIYISKYLSILCFGALLLASSFLILWVISQCFFEYPINITVILKAFPLLILDQALILSLAILFSLSIRGNRNSFIIFIFFFLGMYYRLSFRENHSFIGNGLDKILDILNPSKSIYIIHAQNDLSTLLFPVYFF